MRTLVHATLSSVCLFRHKNSPEPDDDHGDSSIVSKDSDAEMTESESIVPQAIEEPDYEADVLDEFVDDVDGYCGPEEGV